MTTDHTEHLLIEPPAATLNTVVNDVRDSAVESVSMAFMTISLRPRDGESFGDYFFRIMTTTAIGCFVIWALRARGSSS